MTAAPDSEIDWFSSAAGAQGSMSEWDLPEPASTTTPLDPRQTFASPPPPIALEAPPPFESAAPFEPPVDFAEEPAFEAPAATSSVGVVQHTPSLSSPAQLPVIAALPPLADAFAALLAAEANGGAHAATLAWPATDLPAPAITEVQIEDIARRVLDRLSDRIVRETAAEIVSKVAEQLVRDEIERIKASINQQ